MLKTYCQQPFARHRAKTEVPVRVTTSAYVQAAGPAPHVPPVGYYIWL